ncbi:MAG: bifunctional 4-hydroxy-2-oxoglutarate aldolase/2-dehydro-3-deoxy-phosphogluconate aldolase [Spirochaetes bacterium]|nr:bifunctional 4-hydroxy-2-oxoglutarate aldolase/2-dehydro-3-deoxy-phosphogluconate aldolase [Spirochaetota bacterium]
MHDVLQKLEKIGIVPVISIADAGKAVPLAKALIAGGIPCAEITFRTAQGEEAIRRINAEVPDILLGAGTVLTTQQVDKALAAGAKFIISPGFNPKVVAYCIEKGVPVTPGCSTPSDIEKAIEMGLEAVKFFPAEQAGGLDYIKAVSAPYPSMRFIPTGGINAKNIVKYIGFEKIIACGGSWMATSELIAAGDFDKIAALSREAVFNLLGFEMLHFGINTESEAAALAAQARFSSLFGFPGKTGSAIFAGDGIELMRPPFYGKGGHVAIGTNSVLRAKAFFERQGLEFIPESIKTDEKGTMRVAYFKEEIAGFAMHLLQKSV